MKQQSEKRGRRNRANLRVQLDVDLRISLGKVVGTSGALAALLGVSQYLH